MPHDPYVSLHNHSDFSPLDSVARVDGIFNRVAELGQSAVALTDHGSMSSHWDAWKASKRTGVKFIAGVEAYVAPDNLRHHEPVFWGDESQRKMDVSSRGKSTHQTTLALNDVGLKNLYRMQYVAATEGFYGNPRIDLDLMAQHSEGIFVTSGCAGSATSIRLRLGQWDEAVKHASQLKDIYGDRFAVEVMSHQIDEEDLNDYALNQELVKLAKHIGVPLVATNDCHYVHASEKSLHDAFLCQPEGTKVMRRMVPAYSRDRRKFEEVNIENLTVGDRVLSWDGRARRGQMRRSGSEITSIGNRDYCGDLVKITTPSGVSSSYTLDHKTIARIDVELTQGNHLVYLMRRGEQFRIGKTKYRRIGSSNTQRGVNLGPNYRLKEEQADDIWILSIHSTEDEAREAEEWTSQKYGIPTWTWCVPGPRNACRKSFYANLWNRLGSNRTEGNNCLVAFGRNVNFPFLSRDMIKVQRRPREIHACNLMDGMLVAVVDENTYQTNHGSGVWEPITTEREHYEGKVWSMDVANDHTYVADGIVTHNCLQTGSQLSDENRFRFNGDGYHLKSHKEMLRTAEEGGFPVEAISNTLMVAERVESYDKHFEFKNRMPHLPEIEPEMEDDALEEMCTRALEERFANHERYGEYKARMDRELEVIAKTQFSGYHVVLGDILTWAKNRGIRIGPCRGSAGGSLVCYLMNLTGVDPVLHNLPFERYLNLDRVSMPDIDVDIEIDRRSEVVDYVKQRFGEKNVVKILTLGTIKAKAAIKDSGRVQGHNFGMTANMNKMFPAPLHGFSAPLSCVLDRDDPRYGDAKALRAEIKNNPDAHEVYDMALRLEGLIRNFGVHAAGLIISSDPLDDIIPLRRPTKRDAEGDDDLVTGFDALAMEPMGLIKYDFLGLENLTIINKALVFIKDLYDKEIIVEDLSLDDQATYQMLAKGNALGVFQLDSLGIRQLLKRMSPDRFEDICAVIALYRPGPMGMDAHNLYADRKSGKISMEPIHPEFTETLKDILEPTQGVFCFQETVMAALVEVADYSPGQADAVRRIMGKKKPDEMMKLEPELRERMTTKGYSEEAFLALWEILVPFSGYSFNKAHTVGYGLLAYWTAYLKCHYPIAYFAALLSASVDDQDKLTLYLKDAMDNGVAILPPGLNESDYGFTPTKVGIRFGLSAIKGVGESVISEYVNRKIESLNDFYTTISDKVNSRTLASLIQVGALDSFGNRIQHSEKSTDFLHRAKETKKAIAHGDQPVVIGEYALDSHQQDKVQMRAWESELLGTSLTMHEINVAMSRPLTEDEWIWCRTLLQNNPGPGFITFNIDGVRFSTGQMITPSSRLTVALNALNGMRASLD